MRAIAFFIFMTCAVAHAAPLTVRCADGGEQTIDGLLDDWSGPSLARVGVPTDGAMAMRCTWDGANLAVALDLADDRVVRVQRASGHEDRITASISAGGSPATLTVFPGNAIAKSRIAATGKIVAAD